MQLAELREKYIIPDCMENMPEGVYIFAVAWSLSVAHLMSPVALSDRQNMTEKHLVWAYWNGTELSDTSAENS